MDCLAVSALWDWAAWKKNAAWKAAAPDVRAAKNGIKFYQLQHGVMMRLGKHVEQFKTTLTRVRHVRDPAKHAGAV
jgi:hypothetical protein